MPVAGLGRFYAEAILHRRRKVQGRDDVLRQRGWMGLWTTAPIHNEGANRLRRYQ